MTNHESPLPPRPLEGVRILEMGQLLAGPFAAVLLGYFGAEVIKIEPPGTGDPLRKWRKMHNGTALWWYILGRNKKCVTLNLRDSRGHAIVKQLATKVDVVLENFKPGTLEKWGLGYEDLKAINPKLIMARVSGYGQTGPLSSKPGYANVAEGFSGMRYVTGYPDRPPARPNLSLGDTLAGMHAALGILMALYHRDAKQTGQGQMIDVAIYEACFNMMESLIPEYDKLGEIRERAGSKVTGIVPTATYPTRDGKFIIIGGNGDSIYQRLMTAAGRADLANDPGLSTNQGRVLREPEIDAALEAWTLAHDYDYLIAALEQAQVPSGPIYNAADIVNDPHYQARGMFEDADIGNGETVKLPTFVPKMSETPGGTSWVGPALGAHNQEVYGELLGMSASEIELLQNDGVI
ncbi:MAG: CoA transferase [Acidobacteria bacterium]|nr:CoA transferase [Acidobacteriota bacterium]